MKKRNILTVLAIAAFGLVSCNEKPASDESAEASAEASADAYPLETCPVSGEKLGSMGEPIVVEHEGTSVKLCCKECIEKFNAEPEKYTAMVKEAE